MSSLLQALSAACRIRDAHLMLTYSQAIMDYCHDDLAVDHDVNAYHGDGQTPTPSDEVNAALKRAFAVDRTAKRWLMYDRHVGVSQIAKVA